MTDTYSDIANAAMSVSSSSSLSSIQRDKKVKFTEDDASSKKYNSTKVYKPTKAYIQRIQSKLATISYDNSTVKKIRRTICSDSIDEAWPDSNNFQIRKEKILFKIRLAAEQKQKLLNEEIKRGKAKPPLSLGISKSAGDSAAAIAAARCLEEERRLLKVLHDKKNENNALLLQKKMLQMTRQHITSVNAVASTSTPSTAASRTTDSTTTLRKHDTSISSSSSSRKALVPRYQRPTSSILEEKADIFVRKTDNFLLETLRKGTTSSVCSYNRFRSSDISHTYNRSRKVSRKGTKNRKKKKMHVKDDNIRTLASESLTDLDAVEDSINSLNLSNYSATC